MEGFSLEIAWEKGTSANSDAFVANLRRLNSHIQQAGQRTTAHQIADYEHCYKISLDCVAMCTPGMPRQLSVTFWHRSFTFKF